jgi:two-component system, NtrC family, nitrogen regulation sensor histidine kinase NtrY
LTLRARIVAALVLAALIPMAVVIAVPLVQAEKRAAAETAVREASARTQAGILLDEQRAAMRADADRAAESLAGNRPDLAAVVRGPESAARPVAFGLAERFAFDRVEVLGASGATLASFSAERAQEGTAEISERRRVAAESESLTLVAERTLGEKFVESVAAIASGAAHIGPPGAPACPAPCIEVPVVDGAALCVSVTPGNIRAVRLDLLKSFASVAPVAFLAALSVGLLLAGRISRPVRELAERAESISARHAHPITLLPDKDETRRMTLAFDQMLDSLDASERRRLAAERVAAWEEIAKRLAHEIKNPLSPIQMAVENLKRTRERAPAGFDEAFEVETRTILEEVASLRALVDEFAQFARLPRPRVAPCDPRAIVASAIALFSGRAESMGVAVSVDEHAAPATIEADAEQIGRVLKNVLANAFDAMENAAERSVKVTLRRDGDRAEFAVRDTGHGFDKESLRHVFTPYYTTRSGHGGTGLGMAIAQRIAADHGGFLRAEGAPGRGATITLTLPIAGPRQEGG